MLILFTPDDSNLQGKLKKVRVIESSKKIAGSKVKSVFDYTVYISLTFIVEMLCENSKILLDYTSERTVTKQSVRFTVLRSKAVSRLICDKQHQPQLVNYMSTTRQWDFKIQCFGRQ